MPAGGGSRQSWVRADDPLAEPPSWEAAVRYYRVRTGRLPHSKDELINLLSRDVAELDRCLSEQVDAVLHHPRFQALEAAWRGLDLLIDGTGGQENLKVKVLHLPKAQLDADLHGAIEFDQSEFFRKIYEEEYGTAGGEPYGALIGNYEFRNNPSDIDLLSKIKEVAAAAFAPFIAGADPMMFGVPHFGLLPRISNLEELFNSLKFVKWNALREHEDSRYLGLVLPRILMRLPYARDSPAGRRVRVRGGCDGRRRQLLFVGQCGLCLRQCPDPRVRPQRLVCRYSRHGSRGRTREAWSTCRRIPSAPIGPAWP